MITHTISNWVANGVYVRRGLRFNYDGRAWMPALFDTPARQRLWKMSRQVGKTTGGVAECSCRLCTTEDFKILYVAPEQDQCKKYSHDKLTPILEESPVIAKQKTKPDNVFEKGFGKRGNKIYLKYAKHNPDSCRGLTVDMVHYDEVQDQDLDENEPVIRETMFTSPHKISLYTGTPKSMVNPIEKKWRLSDQREWIVRCKHHTPAKWLRLGIRNIGAHGPICHHCGNLLDVDDGVWVAHNPGAKLAGFHVGQLHCKVSHRTPADWDELLDKFENTERPLFLNEVLGESADTAETPITEDMLRRICDEQLKISEDPSPSMMQNYNFAGIDWAQEKATTCIAIGQMDQSRGAFRYVYMRKFSGPECNPLFCIPEMLKAIKRYHCVKVHCDYGSGYSNNINLEDALDKMGKEGLVTANYWSNSAVAADATWNTKHKIPRLTLNKTQALASFINKMRRRKISFPRWSDFAPFAEDFTNVRREYNEKKDIYRYDKAGIDDMFHAAAYAEIIARVYFSSGI